MKMQGKKMRGLFRIRKNILLPVLAAVSALASAEYNSAGIPDSAEIRRTVVDSWLTAPFSDLVHKKPEVRESEIGTFFQVRMEEESRKEFSVIIAPRSELSVQVQNGSSSGTDTMSVYLRGSCGSWILYRETSSGKPVRLVWQFNDDSDVYVQFRPQANKTFVDMLVFGSYAARSVPMGINFERLYTASFDDVRKWTSRTLPWNKVEYALNQYSDLLNVVSVVREKLSLMDYAEDAGYNENGQLYSIANDRPFFVPLTGDEEADRNVFIPDPERLTLCGAGFVKYIIDGIVEPYSGQGTKISDLKEQTVEFSALGKSGVASQDWNLTFTLDWCRNLAAAALSARSSRDYDFRTGGVDVTIEPFASDVVNGVITNSKGYITNTGYSAANLKSLLYVLAVTEPEWFYLAAIRQPVSGEKLKSELAFNNCAVIFPYFDKYGHFACAVFEMNKEYSLSEFMETYKNDYVHLERVKSSEFFYPR